MGKKKFVASCLLLLFAALAAKLLFSFGQNDYSLRQNERRHKFGAVYMTFNNPFYEIIDEEIRAEVETRGDVLLSRDPALNAERQAEEIRELIASGAEVLFVNAVDWKKIMPALEDAQKAGIPVIAIDTDLGEGAGVACTIVSDNYKAGAECALHLTKQIAGGNVVLLCHSEARSAVDRIRGFCDTLRSYRQFHIIETAECKGQLEIAMPVMEKLLAKHETIDVVMALNDPAALGAMAALKHEGKLGAVLVYGIDGTPEAKDMIASGYMTATQAQAPRRIGRLAATKAYELLDGKTPEKIIRLATVLLTRENIAQYRMKEWD